jgi:hypothetical protein
MSSADRTVQEITYIMLKGVTGCLDSKTHSVTIYIMLAVITIVTDHPGCNTLAQR